MVPKSDIDTVHGLCEDRVSEVSVRVALFQTSAARVPNELSVRVPLAQTLAGTAAIWAASEVEAVSTAAPVLAFTRPTIDDDAIATTVLVVLFTLAVPAVMAEPSEEVAV